MRTPVPYSPCLGTSKSSHTQSRFSGAPSMAVPEHGLCPASFLYRVDSTLTYLIPQLLFAYETQAHHHWHSENSSYRRFSCGVFKAGFSLLTQVGSFSHPQRVKLFRSSYSEHSCKSPTPPLCSAASAPTLPIMAIQHSDKRVFRGEGTRNIKAIIKTTGQEVFSSGKHLGPPQEARTHSYQLSSDLHTGTHHSSKTNKQTNVKKKTF